jgi:murein DD-endopeptidase MepM/ murein hydrolase activator NlpD
MWERGRLAHREGDVLYDQFMLEKFFGRSNPGLSQEAAAGVTIPTLKLNPYVVKRGDSLYSIAQRHRISQDTIISANQLKDAYLLRIGTVIQIPNISGIFYTVQRGDSLSSIAARHKIDMNSLLDLNDLDSSVIRVGQRLFIPGASLSEWDRAAALGTLFIYPTRGRLTSKMGFRMDPFTNKRAYHAGIDLANRVGTPITASQSGKITYVGFKGNYGRTVIVKHQQGYSTLYGHLDRILVKRGQHVRQGEKIATMGNTGRSTGPHLHFEILQYRKNIDPLKILHR